MSTAYHDLSKKNQVLFIDWMENNNQDAWITDYDLEELYEEFLDECYGTVTIGGYEYSTSDALKSVDPTAFRCGLNDWSAEEFIEICTAEKPSRVLYLRSDDLENFVEEFLESLETEEE
jgi:hypothetical protein